MQIGGHKRVGLAFVRMRLKEKRFIELLRRGPADRTIEAWAPEVGWALEVSLARRMVRCT